MYRREDHALSNIQAYHFVTRQRVTNGVHLIGADVRDWESLHTPAPAIANFNR